MSRSLLVSWMRHTPTVASHKVVVVVVVAAAAASAARTAPVTRQRLICTLYASRFGLASSARCRCCSGRAQCGGNTLPAPIGLQSAGRALCSTGTCSSASRSLGRHALPCRKSMCALHGVQHAACDATSAPVWLGAHRACEGAKHTGHPAVRTQVGSETTPAAMLQSPALQYRTMLCVAPGSARPVL